VCFPDSLRGKGVLAGRERNRTQIDFRGSQERLLGCGNINKQVGVFNNSTPAVIEQRAPQDTSLHYFLSPRGRQFNDFHCAGSNSSRAERYKTALAGAAFRKSLNSTSLPLLRDHATYYTQNVQLSCSSATQLDFPQLRRTTSSSVIYMYIPGCNFILLPGRMRGRACEFIRPSPPPYASIGFGNLSKHALVVNI